MGEDMGDMVELTPGVQAEADQILAEVLENLRNSEMAILLVKEKGIDAVKTMSLIPGTEAQIVQFIVASVEAVGVGVTRLFNAMSPEAKQYFIALSIASATEDDSGT